MAIHSAPKAFREHLEITLWVLSKLNEGPEDAREERIACLLGGGSFPGRMVLQWLEQQAQGQPWAHEHAEIKIGAAINSLRA